MHVSLPALFSVLLRFQPSVHHILKRFAGPFLLLCSLSRQLTLVTDCHTFSYFQLMCEAQNAFNCIRNEKESRLSVVHNARRREKRHSLFSQRNAATERNSFHVEHRESTFSVAH